MDPAGTGGPPPGIIIPQQQRPSVSFFFFLSLLFFLMSNNNPKNQLMAGNNTMQALIIQRQELIRAQAIEDRLIKRNALAMYLNVPSTQNDSDSAHATTSYSPVNQINPVLLPSIHTLMTHLALPSRPIYHQNLTGFVRGNWLNSNYSYVTLGLEELYTITLPPSLPPLNATATTTTTTASNSSISKRQEINSTVSNHNTTEVKWETKEMNRTTLRGHAMDWMNGGKIAFNFREEQSSAVVGIESLLNLQGGELMLRHQIHQERGQQGDQEWRDQGTVTYLRVSRFFARDVGRT